MAGQLVASQTAEGVYMPDQIRLVLNTDELATILVALRAVEHPWPRPAQLRYFCVFLAPSSQQFSRLQLGLHPRSGTGTGTGPA